jgi:hypothetical protein
VLVFTRGLECYCSEADRPEREASIGRAYIDLAAFSTDPTRTGKSYFRLGAFADRREEAVAYVDAGHVTIQTAPGATGIIMDGRITADSASGRWTLVSRGDTLQRGTFLMRRQARSSFSDSAKVRSIRGLNAWQSDAIP